MPKFYNSDMADLAHQLTISPRRLRVEQIRGIDQLLELVEPDRAYPFEFVCYRITQYRKRGPETGSSIPGRALIVDLVTMAEVISRKANLAAAELGDAYLTHQQLADELQVSTKTVRRWRDRGLMGVRVVFPDGVNRLAFCRSTVDRFAVRHKELVAKGASFRQLTDVERDRIIARARELVSLKPIKLHAVAKVIAEETQRAVETIRYTLRRFDEANHASALFSKSGDARQGEKAAAMWALHAAGESLEAIARAFEVSTEEAASVLRFVQVQTWKQAPIEHIANELFDAPNADDLILNIPEPAVAGIAEPKIPRDVPPYLRSLYLTPLLSAEQERDLFRRYNYLKHCTAKLVAKLDPRTAAANEVDAVHDLLDRIEELKQRIIRANLRLVVSIAKRHVGWSSNFFEVISDGNVSLMRAVEKFDFARGYKFSTYATWAVMKNYARSIPEQHYQCARYVTGQDEVLEAAADYRAAEEGETDRQQVRSLINSGLGALNERERDILSNHFGLNESGLPQTLEQLGQRLGVTKERIRQIEQRALVRLRELLSPTLADAV
jgi:RNA polymerase sigma factor (sigma-70 family)